MIQDPSNTTMGDAVNASLKECGAFGVGQTPLAEDFNDAWARMQWMLQQWERQRFHVYHLVELSVVSTGAYTYTIGPGGDMDTGAMFPPNTQTVRPSVLQAAFLRQIVNSSPNQVDYPLEVLQSREDYNNIALKHLQSFPGCCFLDAAWPLAVLYTYPVPQANIYEIHVTIRQQLPAAFANQAQLIILPFEYYQAIVKNLALNLRPKYGIRAQPGDLLPVQAKTALNVIKNTNAQIGRLRIPADVNRPGIYNIFSDRFY